MFKKIAITLVGCLFAAHSHAVIIGGAVTDIGSGALYPDAFDQGGIFQLLTLPFNPPAGPANTVGNDTFQTPNLYGFNEGQNILLASDLMTNIGGTVASGTTIASHYVFFDPDDSTAQQGYVDFDSNIIAVITSTNLLAASDNLLNNNVTYLNPGARGLEPAQDTVWIGTGTETNRLYVDWLASTPGDFVRVITEFSVGGQDPCATNPPGVGGCPAISTDGPSTMSMILIFFTGLAYANRRRFK
ncbi:hypothetical protein [Glaciecola sp. 1036]|uniref:hypothetical protein n=1 Tax=Alteromonadaceae TaxID=72275 RepID=UPI003D00FE07